MALQQSVGIPAARETRRRADTLAVYDGRRLGVDITEPYQDGWLLRGRMHSDVQPGAMRSFGGNRVAVEAITSYGRGVGRLSAMRASNVVVHSSDTTPLKRWITTQDRDRQLTASGTA